MHSLPREKLWDRRAMRPRAPLLLQFLANLLQFGGNNGGFCRVHQPVLLALAGQQADVTKITRAQSCKLAEASPFTVASLAGPYRLNSLSPDKSSIPIRDMRTSRQGEPGVANCIVIGD